MSYDSYDSYYLIVRLISGLVWLIVGIVMGNKAKEVGLSFWLYFIITWWIGLIGLIVSIAMINRQKKMINMQNMYQNQFQYQNPYQQNPYQQNPYQQNPYQNQQNPYQQNQQYQQYQGQQRRYSANDYSNGSNSGLQLHTCPNCGNTQRSGGFCEICGSKLD